ncbi:MAG: Spy/CpxP family protein refolding chaperone [Proteobacteria bacterium]|nr:Spy/CpxP family protein refolding chaperone [Pseudomonadota bacterium]
MKTKTTVFLSIVTSSLLIASLAFAGNGYGRGEGRKSEGNKATWGEGRGHKGHKGAGKGAHKGPHNGRRGAFGPQMAEALELTAAQKTKIDQIVSQSQKKAEPLVKERNALKEKIRAERQKAQPNETTVSNLRTQMRAVSEKLATQRQETRAAVNKVLTPAQRTKMEELKAARGNNAKRRGPAKGPRPGNAPNNR